MSDSIQHECGIALVRLLRPLAYYQEKYGTPLYGFNKLFLLMEKQHNRGQDGAGIGSVKLNMPAGSAYMFRDRDNGRNPIAAVVRNQLQAYNKLIKKDIILPEFPETVKANFDFGGEVLLGHLRYGTSGHYRKSACQPYYRRSPWPTRNLMLAGNFNMTNSAALNRNLIRRGAHPIFDTDTQTILEEIGYHLDEAHTELYHELRDSGAPSDTISAQISRRLDLAEILRQAADDWDGGYAIAGMIGNGDAFVMRDPIGIRPCHYFADDEVIAVASERVALMTIFDKHAEEIKEVQPGHVLVIKHSGEYAQKPFRSSGPRRSCSFERIYFSRGNDPEIYAERKALGASLAPAVLEEINHDHGKALFSYVPNTAEIAYYGLLDELYVLRRREVMNAILSASKEGALDQNLLDQLIMGNWPRREKIAHKDIKLRTFISQEKSRVQLASHVYDITYGVVNDGDVLVCVDDSIVRGTTLKQSILRILGRTQPAKIVIASTAPQIRYPDCYGIDMSELGKFVAFQAAIELLKETGKIGLLQEVYQACVRQSSQVPETMVNHVKQIYAPFTVEQISRKIAQLVYPANGRWEGELCILFQSIENLHQSCPGHTGDWYFTGNYPTAGGNAVVNQAYINYYENKEGRSY